MSNVTFVSQPTAYDPGADQVSIATPTCCSCCCCCLASTALVVTYVKTCNSSESREAEAAALGPLGEDQRLIRIIPLATVVWLIAVALEIFIPGLVGMGVGVTTYAEDGAGATWAAFLIAFIAVYPFVVWFSFRQGRSMGQLRIRRLLRRAAKADVGETG